MDDADVYYYLSICFEDGSQSKCAYFGFEVLLRLYGFGSDIDGESASHLSVGISQFIFETQYFYH